MPARAVDLDIGTKVVWIHKGRNSYAAEVLQEPSVETYNTDPRHEDDDTEDNIDTLPRANKHFKASKQKESLLEVEDTDKLPLLRKPSEGFEEDSCCSVESSKEETQIELLINIDKKLTKVINLLTKKESQPASKSMTEQLSSSILQDDEISLSLVSKKTPEVYALNLMDTLFTDEEMRYHLLVKKKRSRSTREALDQARVKKLFTLVAAEFGKDVVKAKFPSIIEKCNQKCLLHQSLDMCFC